ncbi:MAG: hypothetical protein KDB03_24560 [Planctomycetales bacterium]|nr:hypothetical protein [Planctomycetales bacterium]
MYQPSNRRLYSQLDRSLFLGRQCFGKTCRRQRVNAENGIQSLQLINLAVPITARVLVVVLIRDTRARVTPEISQSAAIALMPITDAATRYLSLTPLIFLDFFKPDPFDFLITYK